MAPTVVFTLFMNLVEIILHPLSIFTVSGVLQAFTDFVLSMLKSLAMLPVVMIIPLTLTISGRGCLAVSRGRRLVTAWRWRLAVSRHNKLTDSGYGNLRLGVSRL